MKRQALLLDPLGGPASGLTAEGLVQGLLAHSDGSCGARGSSVLVRLGLSVFRLSLSVPPNWGVALRAWGAMVARSHTRFVIAAARA